MPCFVGLDASKRTTKVCVVDELGTILEEGTVESDPKAIVAFLRGKGRRYARVGQEAWSLAAWLYAGLARAGLPIITIEAKHAHGVLKEMHLNKTDKNDARGIAQLMRLGLYKTVHMKSTESQRIQALLTMRNHLRIKVRDIENAIGAGLLVFGQKLKTGGRPTFERRVRVQVGTDEFLNGLVEPLLRARAAILEEVTALEARLRQIAADDPVCRRLMTAPYVGPQIALTFRASIDMPQRFTRSRNVGVHLGLTPRTRQSGEKETRTGITRRGDRATRTALYLAAGNLIRVTSKPSWLKTWGREVAARRGLRKAIVAVARRLASVLHQMWVNETDFRWEAKAA
jgi:transposase